MLDWSYYPLMFQNVKYCALVLPSSPELGVTGYLVTKLRNILLLKVTK